MATVADLIKVAQALGTDDFLKLQTALERVEERLWDRELRQASARHRKGKLTDAAIDEMVLKQRYRGRRS